jgi:hypothetical protein
LLSVFGEVFGRVQCAGEDQGRGSPEGRSLGVYRIELRLGLWLRNEGLSRKESPFSLVGCHEVLDIGHDGKHRQQDHDQDRDKH